MLTQSLDQDAQVTSGETQLKSFGSFLDNYDSRLTSLLNGLTNGHAENFHSNLDKVQIESSAEIPAITISYTPPSECISIFRLADSDNKTLNKVLATFSQLCDEGTKLKTAARQHQFKLLYFDEHLCAYEEQGEECLNGMGDLLELLYSVQYLSQRCITVASTILQQLGALFAYRAIDNRLDLQLAMQFQEVFNRLSETILQLIVFDEILVSSRLQSFWQTYKKAIYSISRNKDRFNHPYTEYAISGLMNVLNSLEMLFAGSLFQFVYIMSIE
ncbi:WASH complex subunit 4-like isoform X2 [Hermetia illucens]|uniref:WASH complex subunit 4-like isoform X2 n=1 Tax=Hermetia illucens TaxID=343691 RepID=UPI0018CC5616|nr:WASH complex subunit 4-like isoform X2 [Hermetia illucens]